MQQEELEALSREAAGCLPWEFWQTVEPGDTYYPRHDDAQPVFEGYWPCENDRADWQVWLHEDTQACTEIMVRVLGDADISIDTSVKGSMALLQQAYDEEIFVPFIPADGDPMLAYRVAVLRALVALKGNKP